MSTQIKNGKRPLSQKTRLPSVSAEDVFMNPIGLEKEMTDAITKAGHVYRYINYVRWQEMGGSHPAHWRPVTTKQLAEWGYDNIGVTNFLNGSDPNGLIRRADLVLAVRPKSINDMHVRLLRQDAEAVENLQEAHARDAVRGRGLKVHAGYQDDYQPELDNEDEG